MNAHTDTEAIVKGVLESVAEDKIVLRIPGTDYLLHLVPAVPASAMSSQVGKRIKGVIHAEALRIHATSPDAGGGRFIEPVIGTPRIVAGRITSADKAANQVVVDVAVPFVVTPLPEQDWSILEPGRMVNFYVRSGATFTPSINNE